AFPVHVRAQARTKRSYVSRHGNPTRTRSGGHAPLSFVRARALTNSLDFRDDLFEFVSKVRPPTRFARLASLVHVPRFSMPAGDSYPYVNASPHLRAGTVTRLGAIL